MKTIALYLPQYHTIPENDLWWGKGFTEWTNVKRGKPYYKNHYQPIQPLNNNYYNLMDKEVMEKQVKIAKKFGVDGFCFYHYYFSGKKLLEKPAEMFLNNKNLEFSFCFSWANQSWQRTWYGKDGNSEMLLKQVYGEKKEWIEHFDYLLPFFKDDRYIKIDNKPVFLIYMSRDFKKCNEMVKLWNEMAKENGLSGIYFVTMLTIFEPDNVHKCFDAAVEFEPLYALREISNFEKNVNYKKAKLFEKIGVTKYNLLNKLFITNYSYSRLVSNITKRNYKENKKKVFLGAFPSWDNTARKDESGLIITGSSPGKFKEFLKTQIKRSNELGNELLFINAWNEWSEGAYLEPDKKYRYAYLNAIKEALKEAKY